MSATSSEMPAHAAVNGEPRPQVMLSPVAAPSILGLFGFAASTFIVSANLAGWYGNETITPLVLFPFTLAFGGIAQLLAAMWCYRARDALGTGIHGAWGSFWIGYGIYMLLVAVHVLPGTVASPAAATAVGYWFIGLAAITWVGVVAALAENMALLLVLLTLAAGSTLLAIGMTAGFGILQTVGALVLIASAVIAWYTASAMVLAVNFGRPVLPVGPLGGGASGQHGPPSLAVVSDEPGVKQGQ